MTPIDLQIRYIVTVGLLNVWECPLCAHTGRCLRKQDLIELHCSKCTATYYRQPGGKYVGTTHPSVLRALLLMED